MPPRAPPSPAPNRSADRPIRSGSRELAAAPVRPRSALAEDPASRRSFMLGDSGEGVIPPPKSPRGMPSARRLRSAGRAEGLDLNAASPTPGTEFPGDRTPTRSKSLADSKKDAAVAGAQKKVASSFTFMTEADLDRLEVLFHEQDKDDSETIDKGELQKLWTEVFPDLSQQEVEVATDIIFEDMDHNGDEELSFEELHCYLKGEDNDDEADIEGIIGGGVGRAKCPPTWRHWLWALVEQPSSEYYRMPMLVRTSFMLGFIIQITIIIATANMIVESMPEMSDSEESPRGNVRTRATETFCVIIFTIEFTLRAIACPWRPEDATKPLWTQKKFWLATFTWVDILAILPYYLKEMGLLPESSLGGSLLFIRVVRLARLARVLRMLKLGRHSAGVQLVMLAMVRARLAIVWMCLLVLMAVVLFASIIWNCEVDDAQFKVVHGKKQWVRNKDSPLPDAGRAIVFQSIPEAMWWGVGTLTTGGYGDVVPSTDGGQAVAAIAMVSGLLVTAYPITIITVTFAELWDKFRAAKERKQRRDRLGKATRAAKALQEKDEGDVDWSCPGRLKAWLLGEKPRRSQPQPRVPESRDSVSAATAKLLLDPAAGGSKPPSPSENAASPPKAAPHAAGGDAAAGAADAARRESSVTASDVTPTVDRRPSSGARAPPAALPRHRRGTGCSGAVPEPVSTLFLPRGAPARGASPRARLLRLERAVALAFSAVTAELQELRAELDADPAGGGGAHNGAGGAAAAAWSSPAAVA